jgi:dTDP-4-amino-4,6-dideoxygalactose transaminase
MIVTRDEELARRCRVMRLHGISRDVFDRYTSTKPAWHYEVVAPGFKYNLTDLAAAVGLHQLKKAWQFQARRQALAEAYTTAFADLPVILPPAALGDDVHAWHLYVLRLRDDAPISRDEFIRRLAERGIGCSVHFIPLHLHPYWRDTYQLTPAAFPCAQAAYERAVSLPLYTRMTADDQQRVIETVNELLTAQAPASASQRALAQPFNNAQAQLAACGVLQ